MKRARARLATAVAVLGGALLASPSPGQQTMLVHLPSMPVENARQQAEAIDALTRFLSGALPELAFEAKIFRRLEDVRAYLAGNAEAVGLALSDAALIDDLPAGMEPCHRFLRQGRSTYRRLLVVRADQQELQKVVDLKNHSLAVVDTADVEEFLRSQVFDGEIEPGEWFGSLETVTDDFEATASVLYGQADAALVAEYNPLLNEHLGDELRVLYESPGLSLPVLSVRQSGLGQAQLDAIENLPGTLGGPDGSTVLAELGLDGLEAIAGRAALVRESVETRKAFALALPEAGPAILQPAPLPAMEEWPFTLAVELPEITVPEITVPNDEIDDETPD